MLSLAAVTVITLTMPASAARDSCAGALHDLASAVRWSPATPRAGTLFRVYLARTLDGGASRTAEVRAAQERAAQLRASSVRLAGEPLHFRSDSTGMTALAAAPIDSAAGVTLELRCGDEPAEQVRIATQAGAYRLERLRVAPRFAASPDSVLAARLRREAESAAAVSRGAHDTPRLFTAPFLAPRVSRVTSGFGGGRTFNGIVTSRHMGVDYQGAVGAPVRAANRGVVRLIGTFYLGGNVIYIDHGDGLVTAYLHLSRQLVAAGDTVARGAIIGRVGATGRLTGPHLHFITRFGQVTVDPASVLTARVGP